MMMRLRNAKREKNERGFVLVLMSVAAIALLGAAGVAIDMGRMFIVKNETQTYCDAEALAAALQLDGTSQGITNATNAVTSSTNPYNFSSTDKWNFNTTAVSSPTIKFAANSSGPWYADAAAITGAGVSLSAVGFAKVTASVSLPVYFVPVVLTNKVYSTTIGAQAIAGHVDIAASATLTSGMFPLTTVQQGSGATGTDFGLVPGLSYDIQWPQFNGHRQGCGNSGGNVDNCFVKPACTDETTYAKTAVVTAWGSQNNGYWGSNSAATLNGQISDDMPLQEVKIGDDFQANGTCDLTHGCLSNGNKHSTAKNIDDRVNSDTGNYQTDYATYTSVSAPHNGRRLVMVPILNPSVSGNTSTSPVVGFAEFLLQSNASAGGTSSYYAGGTGNDPYCAIYVGPGKIGGPAGGVSTTTGISRVRLVF